jgi:tetratricopeptide (TPR) repeat protein
LYNSDKKDEALNCFEKVLKLNPEHFNALNNKGFLLARSNHYENALNCFEKALSIKKDPEVYHNKGQALMDLERYDEALECFEKALQLDPSFKTSQKSRKEILSKKE